MEGFRDIHEDKFKVGDPVIALAGPHKGEEHKIISVRPDGKYNIQPTKSKGPVKYRQGAAAATAQQLKKA